MRPLWFLLLALACVGWGYWNYDNRKTLEAKAAHESKQRREIELLHGSNARSYCEDAYNKTKEWYVKSDSERYFGNQLEKKVGHPASDSRDLPDWPPKLAFSGGWFWVSLDTSRITLHVRGESRYVFECHYDYKVGEVVLLGGVNENSPGRPLTLIPGKRFSNPPRPQLIDPRESRPTL